MIFDFNGTISDDERLLEQIYRELLSSELGWSVSEHVYYREFAGLSDRAIIGRALDSQGVLPTRQRIAELLARKTELYTSALASATTIGPEAEHFVRATAGSVPIALATGAPREEVEFVLARSDLLELFAAIVCLEDVERGKPDPQGYRLALRQLNDALSEDVPVQPGDVLVFEDADAGVQAAKAASMRCVALRTPAYTGVPVAADHTIARLDADLLDSLL